MTKRLDKIVNDISRQVEEVSKDYSKEGKFLGDMLDEKISLSIRDIEYLIMNFSTVKEKSLVLHEVK